MGKSWKNLNHDKRPDVTHSREAMYELTELLTEKAKLTIKNNEIKD